MMTVAIADGRWCQRGGEKGGSAVTEDAALSADERAELERLRAEVADLRSQVATAPASEPSKSSSHPRDRGGSGGAQWSPPC